MRNLFLLLLGALIAFSQFINYRVGEGGKTGLPVVYWVADASKYRRAQFDHLTNWLKVHGAPPFEVRMDPANMAANKIIVQGVTGTAGDIIQCYGNQVRYYAEIGILEDLGPMAKELGIDTSVFSPAFKPLMYYDGKLVAIPANMGQAVFCVNMEAFRKVGMDCPPERWDFDAFERIGKEYIRRVQIGEKRRDRFFAARVDTTIMRNSVGVTIYNETMTAPALNDPRYAEVLKRAKKWTYEDRILPTKADMDSFNQEGDNYGGSSGLLHKGYFAMMTIGRWHFCTTRFMSTDVEYRCVAHPDGGFQNHQISGRTMALYKGSRHKDLAKHFFRWLTSAEYNLYVVGDADGDPPNMNYLKVETYLRPAAYTNEWKYNEVLARLNATTGVPEEISPFVVPGAVQSRINKVIDGFNNSIYSAEDALIEMERITQEGIRDHLKRHPELDSRYRAALAKQKEIDAAKAAGKKIPLDLVENPVLKRYYEVMGKGI